MAIQTLQWSCMGTSNAITIRDGVTDAAGASTREEANMERPESGEQEKVKGPQNKNSESSFDRDNLFGSYLRASFSHGCSSGYRHRWPSAYDLHQRNVNDGQQI